MSKTGDLILLQSKITIPAARDSLTRRPRLQSLLTQASRGRLTSVCAPAGYGKTTLIAQWVRDSELSAAWVSLDETDNDFVKFWKYMTHSLILALPEGSLKRVLPLAYALPNVSVHTYLDALIRDLYALGVPVTVVLDDYHVIRDEQIDQSLVYWIEQLPSHVHILIAGRNDLPFPTSKWLARSEYTLIGSSELQFTAEEMESLCGKSTDLPLSRRHIDKLLERTEGWVTGIQLALLSLRTQRNVDRFIEQFRGNNRVVSDFLFHEAFGTLPAEMQQFLLATSVLNRMDARACDDIRQSSNSRGVLAKLKADNLFLISLDDQDNWFRYHQLFSQFLRNLLQRNEPGRWQEANRLASRSFASRNFIPEAIDHAIEALDYEFAEGLLKEHIAALFSQGEFHALLRWFGSLPNNNERAPELVLFYAFILAMTGQAERSEAELGQVERQYLSEQCEDTRHKIRSGMLFVRSNLIFFSGQFQLWHSFIDETAAGEMLPENRAFYNFNYNLTEPLVRRTSLGLKGVLTREMEMVGLRFVHVLESQGWHDSYINLYVRQSLCEGYYEWNRLHDCRAFFHRIEGPVSQTRTPGLVVPLRIMEARLHAAEGKFRLAHEMIDQAMEDAAELADDHWLQFLRSCKIRILLSEGEVAQAKKWINTLQISEKDKPTLNREFEYLTLVRLLGKQNKHQQALYLLELLKPQARRESLQSSIAEISILQALIEFQRGHRSSAFSSLSEALALGEAYGYIRSFVDEGPVMEQLLKTYVIAQDRASAEPEVREAATSDAYIRTILEAFPEAPTASSYSTESTLIEPLTETEIAMLNMIRKGSSNQQIADELAFSIGTVKVYLSRIYAKLGVSSRTQALSKAEELGQFVNKMK